MLRVIKSRRLRWAGHVARMEGRSAFIILIDSPAGKRPSERPRRRWEDNIRMDLKEIGIDTRNWVDSAQDWDYWRALVNAALYLSKLANWLVVLCLIKVRHNQQTICHLNQHLALSYSEDNPGLHSSYIKN